MSKPVVAIVGRPNVGKSTLFNVLAGEMISIVKDTPGVTRDRIYADVTWLDKEFTMIDTGGIEPESKDIILAQMREQAQIAIDTADVIIFITDVRQGLVDADSKVADMLRRSGKPVVLAVNKVDSFEKFMPDVYEFYNLGIGDPVPVSAASRLGIGDMLDAVIAHFPEHEAEEKEDERPRVAIVGKPNVGKSSIINKLTGKQRVIVSDIAGTTRDIVEGQVMLENIILNIIDTAGIRETEDKVEKIGVEKSLSLIEQADLIIVVLNSNEKLTKEDLELLEKTKNKNTIVVLNKNDLERKIELEKLKEYNLVSTNTNNIEGIDNLKDKIKEMFNLEQISTKDYNYLTNVRQISLAKNAYQKLIDVENALKENLPVDMIEIDLRDCFDILGEITGKTYSDEIIDNLFERFCVGK